MHASHDEDSALLSIRDLHVSFDRRQAAAYAAVRGVSFDVRPGETVGLVGESGSGKSVTAHAILGLCDFTQSVKLLEEIGHRQTRRQRVLRRLRIHRLGVCYRVRGRLFFQHIVSRRLLRAARRIVERLRHRL